MYQDGSRFGYSEVMKNQLFLDKNTPFFIISETNGRLSKSKSSSDPDFSKDNNNYQRGTDKNSRVGGKKAVSLSDQ